MGIGDMVDGPGANGASLLPQVCFGAHTRFFHFSCWFCIKFFVALG